MLSDATVFENWMHDERPRNGLRGSGVHGLRTALLPSFSASDLGDHDEVSTMQLLAPIVLVMPF